MEHFEGPPIGTGSLACLHAGRIPNRLEFGFGLPDVRLERAVDVGVRDLEATGGIWCDWHLHLLVGPRMGKGHLAPLAAQAIHDLETTIWSQLLLDVTGHPSGDDIVCPTAGLAPDSDLLEHVLYLWVCLVPGGPPRGQKALGWLALLEGLCLVSDLVGDVLVPLAVLVYILQPAVLGTWHDEQGSWYGAPGLAVWIEPAVDHLEGDQGQPVLVAALRNLVVGLLLQVWVSLAPELHLCTGLLTVCW